MDIVVTSPKTLMKEAADEAAEAIEFGGGCYYRNIAKMPTNLNIGDKIWYVEDGYLRGFATVVDIIPRGSRIEGQDQNFDCGFVVSDASSWTWINPIRFAGFQGWRYFRESEHKIQIVGDWLDPKPNVMEATR